MFRFTVIKVVQWSKGFPGKRVVKNPPANAEDAGDAGSIPGMRRTTGVEDDNLLQYSCLQNSNGQRPWWATVHKVEKSGKQLSDWEHTAHDDKMRMRMNVNRNRRATNGFYISSLGQTISMFLLTCRRLYYIRWECVFLMLLSHLNICQYSGLENSKGVSKSRTQLSDFHFLFKSGVYWCLIVNRLLLLLFSCVWLFATPGTAAHQVSLSISISQSLLTFMSIKSVMPFNYLVLCHPLLLLPSIFTSIKVFLMSQFFASGGQSIGA